MRENRVARLVKTELNIEKLWNIWQPIKLKKKQDQILIERSEGLSKCVIEVTSNVKYGPLTTEAQKVLYALFKIFEEQNYSPEIQFSVHRVARMLEKGWSKAVKVGIEVCLYQLRGTLFVMTNYFYDSETKTTLKLIETFTLLSDLKIARQENDGHVTTEECYCKFHELIQKNLKNNYVKPVILDVVIEIGDDGIAQVVYTHLDLILSETNPYKRRAERLFKELNLVGERYKKLSYRRETLARIIKILEGKRLSKGGTLHLTLELTVDQKDYNLICERVDSPQASKNSKEKQSKIPLQDEDHTNRATSKELPLEEEFVKLFFRNFKVRRNEVTKKEVAQAKACIDSYQLNLKECQYIIDYTLLAADKTNYKPEYFGGILQYIGEAIEQYRNTGKHKANGNTENSSRDCSLCHFTDGYLYITYENGVTDRINCCHDEQAIKNMVEENKFRVGICD